MAPKKRPKKQAAGAAVRDKKRSKITLPAFGLAEDILAVPAAAAPEAPERAAHDDGPPAAERGELLPEALMPAEAANGDGDGGEQLHLVTFLLEREEYAVNIESVQEIIRVGQITGVPNSPTFVKGVINLRGRVIPVLNLRKRLDLPEGEFTKDSRIMIVESGVKVLGLLVDGVSQVMRLPVTSVDTPPSDVDQGRAFVRGIGKIDSRLIMIMDLERVLAKETSKGAGVVPA
jgi:purine-binding chemotaxis protein CheW